MNSNSNQNFEQNQNEIENYIEEEELNDMEIQNQNESNNNNEYNTSNNENDNKIEITDPNNEPIYVMTLAVEEGKSEKIEIFSNSDPSELAYNFCSKYNLDYNTLDYLKEQITNLLEIYNKKDNDEEEDENILNEEDIKEGDINIPEIEETQEEQEINSIDNLKENKIDNKNNNNINNDNIYIINTIDNEDIQKVNVDLSRENNENNMEINDNEDENEDNKYNNVLINNDDEEDNENHEDDEIVEEIDFLNIGYDENEAKNDKEGDVNINENVESLPDTHHSKNNNDDNKENDIENNSNKDIKEDIRNINGNKNDKLEKELFLVENNDDKEADNNENYIENESEINYNSSKEINEKDNIYDKNKTKKKYKINEDIIIGVGDFNNNNKSNEELEINEIETNDIEKMKKEIIEKENNFKGHNNIYNNLGKSNEKEDFFINENINCNNEERINVIFKNNENNKIRGKSQINKKPKKEKNIDKEKDYNYILEELQANNYIQETKTNTNNNVLLNEEEVNGNYTKNENFIFHEKEFKKEYLLNKNNKILNNSSKKDSNNNINIHKKKHNNIIIPQNEIKNNDLTLKSYTNKKSSSNKIIVNKENINSLNNKDRNNDFKIKNDNDNILNNKNIYKNNNIIIPKDTNNIGEKEYQTNSNKNIDIYNNKLYNNITNKDKNEKRKTYTYKSSVDNNSKKNYKRIKQNEKLRHSEMIDKNAKNYIKYLSERNKLLKEEKDKELKSLEKEINKCDSKKNLKNKNINNVYEIQNYKNNIKNNFLKNKTNNNQIHSTNYYNKNISLRKLNKLKEEYDKIYSFQPVINDNYKTDLTFNERLSIFNNISKQKKEELKNNLTNLKSDENGQELFKPKLIAKQYFLNNYTKNNNFSLDEIKNNEKMDVFNKNYLYYKKYNSNKAKLYNKYYDNYTNEPFIFSKIQSDKLLNEANNKAFSNLFNELDSDQDNLITSLHINLNNIPNNIIKIIEPLLIELKEDNQTLNQDEFIKAMTKLFENISSTERRLLVNEYNNRKQKAIKDKNLLNNFNKNKIRKNNSLTNGLRKNNISNINNFSNSRMNTRNNISTDNNNFDNNYMSCRPRTPVYNMVNKSSSYSYFNNLSKKKSQKTITYNNTNKLAHKHFMKVQKMMSDYNNKYTPINNNKVNDNDCFDKIIAGQRNQNSSILNTKTPKISYRSILLNKNKKFTLINNCTFNNYLKNLN